MTETIDADICVIGAGSGGLSVAAGAAQLGRKVVLCEKGEMGGDCLNYGCVPSKSLIAAAAAAANVREAHRFGVDSGRPDIDFSRVMAHVHGVIAAIAPHDSQERFEGLGVQVIRKAAHFTGRREVVAGDTTIRAKHFVIATGASPLIPPIPGLDTTPYLTNETVFDLQELPERLIMIGGGPIGAELAQAFGRLGSNVAIVEAAQFLGREDRAAADIVRIALAREGVEILEGAAARSVSAAAGGVAVDIGDKVLKGSHLLVAVGRRPNIEGLHLEAAGVTAGKAGIDVDGRLRTANRRIYAIGDVCGGAQFTHVAGDHASTVIRNILFKTPAKRRDALAPRVTYTDPEVASIGSGIEDAGADARVVEWSFTENDRAQTEGATSGFAKVIVGGSGRVIGGTIVGKGAGDHIQPLALAIANGLKIGAFTKLIAPYPTRGEVLKRAAGAWYSATLFSDRTRWLVRLLSVFD